MFKQRTHMACREENGARYQEDAPETISSVSNQPYCCIRSLDYRAWPNLLTTINQASNSTFSINSNLNETIWISNESQLAKGPKECQESCRRKVLLPLPTEKIRKWSDTMKENLSNTSATSLFSFKVILGILVAVMFYPHFSLKYIHLSQPVNCIWSKIPALLRQYLTVYFQLHLSTPQNNDNMTKRRGNTIMCALSSSIQNQVKETRKR